MKFSKYISKAVTPVMALFQKQHGCLSNKSTTICGYSVCSLRQVPVRHNRGGKSTENKVRFAPPTMCRLTGRIFPKLQSITCESVIIYFLQNIFGFFSIRNNHPVFNQFIQLFIEGQCFFKSIKYLLNVKKLSTSLSLVPNVQRTLGNSVTFSIFKKSEKRNSFYAFFTRKWVP